MSLVSQIQALATRIATEVKGKAPITHGHSISDVTGLSTALAGKLDDTQLVNINKITASATDPGGADGDVWFDIS